MSFQSDLQFGKKAEKLVMNILEDIFEMQFEDVSDDREYQKQDVDILADFGKYKIEVKSDRTTTPNIFFETESNSRYGTQGCMMYTTADILFYVHYGHEVIFTIPMDPFRDWVLINRNQFREVGVGSSYARGLLIPIEYMKKNIKNIGIIPITDEIMRGVM